MYRVVIDSQSWACGWDSKAGGHLSEKLLSQMYFPDAAQGGAIIKSVTMQIQLRSVVGLICRLQMRLGILCQFWKSWSAKENRESKTIQ